MIDIIQSAPWGKALIAGIVSGFLLCAIVTIIRLAIRKHLDRNYIPRHRMKRLDITAKTTRAFIKATKDCK